MMENTHMRVSNEARETLRRLWRNNASYSVICQTMGITKGLAQKRVARDPELEPRANPAVRRTVERVQYRTVPLPMNRQHVATPAPRECQWMTSNGKPWVACCAPTLAGKAYCADHARLVFIQAVSL